MIETKPGKAGILIKKISALVFLASSVYFIFWGGKSHYHASFIPVTGALLLLIADMVGDIRRKALPASFGVFAAILILFLQFFINKANLGNVLFPMSYATGIVLLFLAFRYLLPAKGDFGQLEIYNKEAFSFGIVSIVISAIAIGASFFLTEKNMFLFLVSVSFVASPAITRRFFATAEKGISTKHGSDKLELIKKLSGVKTVAFDKNDILKTKTETSYLQVRQTVKRESVINIINVLKPELLCVNDKLIAHEFELNNIERNEVFVSGVGLNDTIFKLTTQIPEDETGDFVYFLLKNEQVMAKIYIEFEIEEETVNLIQELDEAGINTVMLCAEDSRIGKKIELFDKIYSNLNIPLQKDMLSRLSAKAPVMYSGTNPELQGVADADFETLDFFPFVADASDAKQIIKGKKSFLWMYYIATLPALYYFPIPAAAVGVSMLVWEVITRRAFKDFAE